MAWEINLLEQIAFVKKKKKKKDPIAVQLRKKEEVLFHVKALSRGMSSVCVCVGTYVQVSRVTLQNLFVIVGYSIKMFEKHYS